MRYRPEYDMKVIGENLRRLREAKSLSVKEVQKYLRLGSVQAVYKYENGKGYPQADTMFALMELYEASLSDIICKHEEENVYNLYEENREQSFAVSGYYMYELNMDIENYRSTQSKHLYKHMKLYKQYLENGIAG